MRSLLVLAVVCVGAAAQEDDPIGLAVPGAVVNAKNEPLSGVRVEAWDALEPDRFLSEGASGADGRFLLVLRRSDLARREHPFGPLRFTAFGEGLATVFVEAPAVAREVRLVAVPAREVHGSVHDALGAPVPGAIVRGSAGGVVEETTAAEDGRFVLSRFGPVRVELRAYRDHVGLSARAVADGADVSLVLPRAARVAGRVVALGSGEPVAGARVFWRDRAVAESDASGAFAVAVNPLAQPLALFVVALPVGLLVLLALGAVGLVKLIAA